MTASSQGGRTTWTSKGNWRGRDRLKHLGSRRGDGVVVWEGLAVPAAYELDVFSLGATRTLQGNLEGDFRSFLPAGEPPARMAGAQLRLEDGRQIAIDLIDLEPSFAAFDASGEAVSADLLG